MLLLKVIAHHWMGKEAGPLSRKVFKVIHKHESWLLKRSGFNFHPIAGLPVGWDFVGICRGFGDDS